jgi:hypothetical protein
MRDAAAHPGSTLCVWKSFPSLTALLMWSGRPDSRKSTCSTCGDLTLLWRQPPLQIKSGKSQEEALAAVRPAKAPRRSGGSRSPGGRTGGRASFQVPSGGHPGAPRAEDVLDSLAAAAAVVSGGSTGPTGAGSMDEGRGCKEGVCTCELSTVHCGFYCVRTRCTSVATSSRQMPKQNRTPGGRPGQQAPWPQGCAVGFRV